MDEHKESLIPEGWREGETLLADEPARDFKAEVEEARKVFPDFTEVPGEVAAAVARGVPLTVAVAAFRDDEHRKQMESLQKENRILKQNASNQARAVVRGTGGVPKQEAENDFLKGFNS